MERPGRIRLDRIAIPLIALVLAFMPASGQAQQGEVKGRVVEMGTGRPLVGAEVFFPTVDRWVLTNEAGDFHIKGLPAGAHRMTVGQLGYRQFEGEAVVGSGAAIRLELWPDPVVLEGLSAQVDRLKARRNAIGTTTRISDRTRLSTANSVEDAVRGMGESLTFCGRGDYCLMRRGRLVRPVVYIDERPAFDFEELRSYQPGELHLIEVIGHEMIRAYTVTFMERLALGKVTLFPVLY
jgi:hypothetical protein